MTRPNRAQAPQGASGTCRDRRRPQGERRRAWVRPFLRVHHALNSTYRLIAASQRTAARSERCAHRRPIRSSVQLWDAGTRLATASARLNRAASALEQLAACLDRDPAEWPAELPRLLVEATERWVVMAQLLAETSNGVFEQHSAVLEGLETGTLVPERPAPRRPRIALAPRPAPVRAFLRARLPRVRERISPLLRRRRRTPRPSALSVPPRTAQGRAPPFSPVCPL